MWTFDQLSAAQHEQFERLVSLFLEQNRQLNLSAIRDADGVRIKHVVDSLQIVPLPCFTAATTLLDVGSGGGFPALPLALYDRRKQVTALDSTHKKMSAVEKIAAALGLTNLRTLVGRAEVLSHDEKYRERYDLVVARAVAYLPVLLEYCLPFVAVGGYMVAYKLVNPTEFSAAAEVLAPLGGVMEEPFSYRLPEQSDERQLIIIHKTTPTLWQYPRETAVLRQLSRA